MVLPSEIRFESILLANLISVALRVHHIEAANREYSDAA